MSGATLCALLGELGYEGADALDPDSFEWPFQYDDARPILDWICSSLRPSNIRSICAGGEAIRGGRFGLCVRQHFSLCFQARQPGGGFRS
ncbi:AUGMIN subunit 3-like [Malus domestica]|uniref:AUGMIN subunit 3-like n=1 Tax=Malus domestica TaxID=3750 RepID=UPI00397664DC